MGAKKSISKKTVFRCILCGPIGPLSEYLNNNKTKNYNKFIVAYHEIYIYITIANKDSFKQQHGCVKYAVDKKIS